MAAWSPTLMPELLPVSTVAPDVTVIHAAVLVAVHEHVFEDAVTVTLPALPAAATARLAGASEYVHAVPILMTKASAHGKAKTLHTPPPNTG